MGLWLTGREAAEGGDAAGLDALVLGSLRYHRRVWKEEQRREGTLERRSNWTLGSSDRHATAAAAYDDARLCGIMFTNEPSQTRNS